MIIHLPTVSLKSLFRTRAICITKKIGLNKFLRSGARHVHCAAKNTKQMAHSSCQAKATDKVKKTRRSDHEGIAIHCAQLLARKSVFRLRPDTFDRFSRLWHNMSENICFVRKHFSLLMYRNFNFLTSANSTSCATLFTIAVCDVWFM
jgi:hypothetical protein